ncbi:hypothetical protein [Oceanospirillum sp.]|uniref:hypothetical protein n=1 Tax=Oceanospirillum sp. TaxID=2021254 RepID=UPI003A93FAED
MKTGDDNVSVLVEWLKSNTDLPEIAIEHFVRMCLFLRFPRDLIYFFFVLETLIELLEIASEVDGAEHCKSALDFELALDVLHVLQEHEEAIILNVSSDLNRWHPSLIKASNTDKHPFWGGFQFYPVYSFLFNSADTDDEDHKTDYRYLQANTLITVLIMNTSAVNLTDIWSSWKSYAQNKKPAKSYVISACRFVRASSDQDHFDQFEDVRSESFIEVVEERGHVSGEDRPVAHTMLNSLFCHAYDVLFPYQKAAAKKDKKTSSKDRKTKHRKKQSNQFSDGFVLYPAAYTEEDISGEFIGLPNLKIKLLGDKKPRDGLTRWRDWDVPPEELSSDPNVVCIDDIDSKNAPSNPRSMARHISMSNQCLKVDWGRLTHTEMAQVMNAIMADLSSGKLKAHQQEVLVMLLLSIWLGRSIDELKTLCWLGLNARPDKNKIYIQDDCEGKVSHFVFSPVKPSLKKHLSAKKKQHVYPQAEFIKLPDILHLGSIIEAFCKPAKMKEKDSALIFTRRVSTYKDGIRAFIGSLDISARVSLPRLHHYLHRNLVFESNADLVDATLLTSQFRTPVHTLLHYTATSEARLTDIYLRTVKACLAKLKKAGMKNLEGVLKDSQLFAPVNLDKSFAGSPSSPKSASVRIALDRIRKDLMASQESSRERHNLFTLYNFLFQSYQVGIRAVLNPFLWLENIVEIDGSLDVVMLSDKDNENYFNSRIVPITERLKNQMAVFEKYHRKKVKRLAKNNSVFSGYFSQPKPSPFFLDQNGNPETLRPKVIERYLRPYLPLPANSNRKFLRTELNRMGCDQEVIDAFLGHWSRGQEPWGEFSTVSSIELAKAIAPKLDCLAESIGLSLVEIKA